MQTVKRSAVYSQVMKDHPYKVERNENCSVADGDYDNVELVSKSGDSLLISLVQNYPHLYVKTSKNQKDHSLRERSWQEIAAILEQPAGECLKRWTRLRERYSKEKRLAEQSSCNGRTSASRQCWTHYAEMGFLAQHIVGRRSYRNMNSRIRRTRFVRRYSNESPSPLEHTVCVSPAPFTATLVVPSPSPSPSISRVVASSPELLSPAASEPGQLLRHCNQRGKLPEMADVSFAEAVSTVANHFQDSSRNQQFETSEDLFCRYLASEMKKMSEDEKKATTRRLMDALFQGNT